MGINKMKLHSRDFSIRYYHFQQHCKQVFWIRCTITARCNICRRGDLLEKMGEFAGKKASYDDEVFLQGEGVRQALRDGPSQMQTIVMVWS